MKTTKRIVTYFVIVGLALLSAVSYQLFIFPNRFAPAGLNGICTMIQYVFNINVGYLSLMINVPLALLVLRRIGKSLAGRSMLYVVSFSLFLIVLEKMDLQWLAYETDNGTSTILGPLVAGLITGVCTTTLVRCSACTGGIDFVAAAIHRVRPDISFFYITFFINALIAVCSYFVYDYEIEPVILCIMYSFMASTVSDHMMKSFRRAVHCEIITDYPEEISQAIISELHHSATLIPAKGMYKGKETHILMCIINKNQLPAIASIIKRYPHSFATISMVSEVVGNFKRIDNHGKPEVEILDKGDGQTV